MASQQRPTGLIASEGIKLLTYRTPNGHKASILLEELKEAYGIEYTFQTIDLATGVNHDPWFKALSPNSQIPCIVDHDHNKFTLPASSAIMNYLIARFDTAHKFSFPDLLDNARCDQWLSFATGDLTPASLSGYQFYRFLPNRYPFPTYKAVTTIERCYDVLNSSLVDRDYLVGPGKGKYSVADMANWSFVNFTYMAGAGSLGKWPELEKWWQKIWERRSVVKGTEIPFRTIGMGNASFEEEMKTNDAMRIKEAELAEELRRAREMYGPK